jgi:hypothetical protein
MVRNKISFPLLPAIAGLLFQFQSVAIGNELKSGQSQVENAPGQETTRSADPPVSAELAVLQEVATAAGNNPANAPQMTAQSIRTNVPRPVPEACEIVRAAIEGLGKQATNVIVARIVYAAVTVAPTETLSIVAVAIQSTPPSFHKDVVNATIAAVPDPYACVSLPVVPEPCRQPVVRQQGLVNQQPIIAEPCSGPTLAEAIFQEALLSGAAEADFLFNPNLGYTGDYGVTGIANDNPITKQPPKITPPPTPPPPVSP